MNNDGIYYPEVIPSKDERPNSMQVKANNDCRVYEEYYENVKKQHQQRVLVNMQNQLGTCCIRPLDSQGFAYNGTWNLPPSLVNTANALSQITGLDPLGSCILLLGATSIATWGRVRIVLTKHWTEPAIDMLIHVAPSGRRKSGFVSVLRAPFDTFCQEINQGHEEKVSFHKVEAGLMKRTADKIALGHIQESINIKSNDSNGKTFEIQDIKRAVRKATMTHQALMEDIHAKLKPAVQLLVNKATPFQLANTLAEQGECQGCITAEGDMLLSSLLGTKNAPGDPGLFLRGHTQEPYVYDNAQQKISLGHPAIPMINLVQNIVASKFYGNSLLNQQGVTARFVPFIHGNSSNNTTTSELPDDVFDAYNSKLEHVGKLYHTQDKNAPRYTVRVSPAALQLVRDFELDIKQNIIPNMPKEAEPCLLKAHGQAVRFAWDIHVWNWNQSKPIIYTTAEDGVYDAQGKYYPSPEYYDNPHDVAITEVEMQQAIALMYASFNHIRFAYAPDGLTAHPTAEKIVESLMRINDNSHRSRILYEGIDSTTIQQRIGVKSIEVNNALRLLEKHNALRIYDSGTNNLKVILHPYFFNFQWIEKDRY